MTVSRREQLEFTIQKPLIGNSERFVTWANEQRIRIERALLLELDVFTQHEVAQHSPLLEAMKHGVMNGGKRIRALAVLAAAELVDGQRFAMQPAIAIEFMHAYSLIHDDLPCMDNDVLRRGKPTVHIIYGEAQALLAGDALQTLAFEILSNQWWQAQDAGDALPKELCLAWVTTLAQASGFSGMVGGQAIDCFHEDKMLSNDVMRQMHQLKTGALISASMRLGAMTNPTQSLSGERRRELMLYADKLGLLFQVVDDILDASQDTATLGKTAGKDAQANKPTYVTTMGLEPAKAFAQKLDKDCLSHIAYWGNNAQKLADLAAYCHERIY